jgi:hypothetical protein
VWRHSIRFLAVLILGCFPEASRSVSDAPSEVASNSIASATDFRVAAWGLSLEEVKALEPGTWKEEIGDPFSYLSLDDRLEGLPCRVVYQFYRNRLVRGSRVVEGEHLPEEFLEWFVRIRESLTKRMGPPLKDEVRWTSERDRERSDRLENGLWAGYASRVALWSRPPTRMALSVRSPGGPANLKLILTHESMLLSPLADLAMFGERISE